MTWKLLLLLLLIEKLLMLWKCNQVWPIPEARRVHGEPPVILSLYLPPIVDIHSRPFLPPLLSSAFSLSMHVWVL